VCAVLNEIRLRKSLCKELARLIGVTNQIKRMLRDHNDIDRVLLPRNAANPSDGLVLNVLSSNIAASAASGTVHGNQVPDDRMHAPFEEAARRAKRFKGFIAFSIFASIVLATALCPWQYTEFTVQRGASFSLGDPKYNLVYAYRFSWIPMAWRRCNNVTLEPHLSATGATIGGMSNVWLESSCDISRGSAYNAVVTGAIIALSIQFVALMLAGGMVIVFFVAACHLANADDDSVAASSATESSSNANDDAINSLPSRAMPRLTDNWTSTTLAYVVAFCIFAFAVPFQRTTFDALDSNDYEPNAAYDWLGPRADLIGFDVAHVPHFRGQGESYFRVRGEWIDVRHNYRLCYIWIIGEQSCSLHVSRDQFAHLNTTRSFDGYASFPAGAGTACVTTEDSGRGALFFLTLWAFWSICVFIACLALLGFGFMAIAIRLEELVLGDEHLVWPCRRSPDVLDDDVLHMPLSAATL